MVDVFLEILLKADEVLNEVPEMKLKRKSGDSGFFSSNQPVKVAWAGTALRPVGALIIDLGGEASNCVYGTGEVLRGIFYEAS